jgi:hypothetical protein
MTVLYIIYTQNFSFFLTENERYALCKDPVLNTLQKRWPTLVRKGAHSLLWVGSSTACAKVTINGIPNLLNYFVIFVMGLYKYTLENSPRAEKHITAGRKFYTPALQGNNSCLLSESYGKHKHRVYKVQNRLMISLPWTELALCLGLSSFNITLSEQSLNLQRPKCPQSRLESRKWTIYSRFRA